MDKKTMSLIQIAEKIFSYLRTILFCSILIGCSSSPYSNIQNIRQIDNSANILKISELKLMTFNIRVGLGTENPNARLRSAIVREENLEKIAAAIKSVDPDIVGLQEVRGYNQAKYFAEKLNMNFAYSPHGSSDWWGLALLSKFQITDVQAKLINYSRDNRIALKSTIDINGKMINVINVHYALENYSGQVKATMSIVNETEGPMVLLGDLNRYYYHPELGPIKEKFIDSCYAINTNSSKKACSSGTWGGFFLPQGTFVNGTRIDYIFVDSKYFNVIDVGLTPKEYYYVSDHRAFWSKLKIKN